MTLGLPVPITNMKCIASMEDTDNNDSDSESKNVMLMNNRDSNEAGGDRESNGEG